jgi:hypothetical protein
MLNTNFVPQLAGISQPSTPLRIPDLIPVHVIRGHSLVHQELPPATLARMAADWLDRRAVFVPTLEQAAWTFRVSRQLIRKERRPNYSAALGLLTYGWTKCSEAERVVFCGVNETGIWSALERVADHQ